MNEISTSKEMQNNLVYITESSYKQLVRKSDINSFDIDKVKVIFNQIYDNWRLYKMFNKSDFKFLYKSYLLLSGESESVFYKEVEERKDDYGYIFELKGKLKYHLNPNCERLNNGFRNFIMPEPIATITDQNRKNELVNEIRNWFKLNNYTVERFIKEEINNKILTEAFNNYFPAKFNIERIIISQSDPNQFKWYIEKKSESVSLEYQFSQESFNKNIDLIISERNKLCKISKPLYNLSKYDFLLFKEEDEILDMLSKSIGDGYLIEVSMDYIKQMGLQNLMIFWKLHIELKQRAKQELDKLLKWKFNLSKLGLHNIQLENFNFECCVICKENKNKIDYFNF